jgi:alkylated DNA repair dioxygenase AlkB
MQVEKNNDVKEEKQIKEVKKDIIIDLGEHEAQAWVVDDFLNPEEEPTLFQYFQQHIPFIRHTIYPNTNRERKQARKSCSMGNSYPYSGTVHPESAWDPKVLEIMNRVNKEFQCNFNSCLVNYYENGNEYISPHSDDERSLDAQGQVVSVSFGSTREMHVLSKNLGQKYKFALKPGSLFMMQGTYFQKLFTHGIPKTTENVGPRISLTFRRFVK